MRIPVILWGCLISGIAHGGYGVVVDDRPGTLQRQLHTFTNFIRVAPTQWEDRYGCPLSEFEPSELLPKETLRYHDGLTEIAQLHTLDMATYDLLSHDSSDGTPFGERVWPYYDGTTIGENVAQGYPDSVSVVFEGWMCSAGHRANIMDPQYDDIGVGVVGTFHTQDFGGGAGVPRYPIAMATHDPYIPGDTAYFYTTWDHELPPSSLQVETDTACLDMSLLAGTETLGAWHVEMDAVLGCQKYRFLWSTPTESGVFPEEGSYQYGSECDTYVTNLPETSCNQGAGPDDDDTGDLSDSAVMNDTGIADTEDTPPSTEDTGDDYVVLDLNEDNETNNACGCRTSPKPHLMLIYITTLLLFGLRRRNNGYDRPIFSPL